jgi:hypothetical protein
MFAYGRIQTSLNLIIFIISFNNQYHITSATKRKLYILIPEPMKKNLITLLLFVLRGITLNAQTETYKDKRKYFDYINQAELSITSGDIQLGLNNYQRAFKINSLPFASDLYNASMCAISLNRFREAMSICWQLAESGVASAFFDKASAFSSLKKERKWSKLLQHADEVKNQLAVKYKVVNDKISTLYQADQKMHSVWASSDHNRKLAGDVRVIDDSISRELMDMFETNGYLSEFKVGVSVVEDTILTDPEFTIIMLHNYQGLYGNSDTLFSTILWNQLLAGTIRPDFYAKIQDGGSSKGDRPYYGSQLLYWNYKCKLYRRKVAQDLIKKIEANRQIIGLPPLSDLMAKILFNAERRNHGFLIDQFASGVHRFSDSHAEQNFLSGLDPLTDIANCENK